MILPAKATERGILRHANRRHNQLVDYVRSLTLTSTPSVKVNRGPQGTRLRALAGAATDAAGRIQLVELAAVNWDTLTVGMVGSPSQNQFDVLKPPTLQAPVGGGTDPNDSTINYTAQQTRTRQLTLDITGDPSQTVIDVEEEVWPVWTAADSQQGIDGDLLIVIRELEKPDSDPVSYDLNIDGRHWRPIIRATEVCVNGETNYAAILRSTAQALLAP